MTPEVALIVCVRYNNMEKVGRVCGHVERRSKWTGSAVNKFAGHFILVISAHGPTVRTVALHRQVPGSNPGARIFVFARAVSIFVSAALGFSGIVAMNQIHLQCGR